MSAPRIVLLHATPVAMEPVHAAFARLWPDAERINLLDDGLSIDRAREDALSERMIARFVTLCRYGYDMGADGLLVTCSAFGPAIEQAARELPIPVLKPNEAMFQAALAAGSRIGMIATFAPALITMEDEFREEAARSGREATLTSVVVPEAMAALKAGDAETHNRLVVECADTFAGYDALMLAHFSTARAAPNLSNHSSRPVFSAPEAAVAEMRRRVVGTVMRAG